MRRKDKAALKAVKEQLRQSAAVKQQIMETVRSCEAQAPTALDDAATKERRP
jgi:hypothetical protein